jgi:VanZ family protein
MGALRTRQAGIALSALAYAALVAHLLFIPYAFSPLPFREAFHRFAEIRWLGLGSDQNVALVSRALMWLPLGVLLAAAVAPHRQRWIELPALLIGVVLGCSWAVAVNFTQIWFPGRTLSLNYLVAECSGVAVGALLWSVPSTSGLRWSRRFASGGRKSLEAALGGYVVVYLLWSLTPFDFVTSAADIQTKLDSNLYGSWLAPGGCGPFPCGLKFLAVAIASVPCGWWIAARRSREHQVWLTALLLSLAVSTLIELLHFMMVSGVSQGASVAARTAGVVLGTVSYSARRWLDSFDLTCAGRPTACALLVPYLFLVLYAAGWSRAERLRLSDAVERIDQIVWLPFYYTYYNAYQATMLSALVHFVLYAPVGAICWLWDRSGDRVPVWFAASSATLLCFAVETSKLFLSNRTPDYSDVLIACVAATLALTTLRLFSRQQVR